MLNWFYEAKDLNLDDAIRDIILLAAQPAKTLEMIRFWESTKQTKLSYYEEKKQLYTGVIASAFADATTLWPIAVSDSLGTVMFPNHQIQVEDEQMIVNTVVKTAWAMTFTVKSRWHAWTTAVAHSNNSPIVILAISEPEWVVSNSYAMWDRILRENTFQELTTNIMLTNRATEVANKDRDDLWAEEVVRRFWKHIRQIDNILRIGHRYFDANLGQNTLGGYEPLSIAFGAQSQASLGYANGAFSYTNRQALMRESHNRSSNANLIHTNAQTKAKILALIPDKEYRQIVPSNEGQKAGMFFDGIIAGDWDGRILNFYIDDKIVWNQFNLVNFDNMEAIPRTTIEWGDKMFVLADEPTNSSLISQTLKSELSLEVKNGEQMSILKNI